MTSTTMESLPRGISINAKFANFSELSEAEPPNRDEIRSMFDIQPHTFNERVGPRALEFLGRIHQPGFQIL